MRECRRASKGLNGERMKVAVIFGTRPEAIKMAPVVSALRAAPGVETSVWSTGQHRQMLDRIFAATPAARNGNLLLVDGTLITWFGTRLGRALDVLPDLVASIQH